MIDWHPTLSDSNAPRYQAIADCIETDVHSGRLNPGDRLPAQRQLAARLGLDFTTVARGYAEARRRGIIASQVGSGTYVAGPRNATSTSGTARRGSSPDRSMNLPPEPEDQSLLARMREGLGTLATDLVPLLRYQSLESSDRDREAAAIWLEGTGLSRSPADILFSPGTQAGLAGALPAFCSPGDRIVCEALTYPGIRSICAQLHLTLTGLAVDEDGLLPDALEAACNEGLPKALYINPTLANPTTRTMPDKRRREIVEIARRHNVAILEDDAYGQLSRKKPIPFAVLAPELTWHFASMSKCTGAGLRLAYVVAPDKKAAWQFSRSVRSSNVMASPLSVALATGWIEDGTAHALLSFIRTESAARQQLASRHLPGMDFLADPNGFHLWLKLPGDWTRSTFVGHMRDRSFGVVESDAFAAGTAPPEAVRICLGGPAKRETLAADLDAVHHALEASPQRASVYF